jgi:hypothetical protein
MTPVIPNDSSCTSWLWSYLTTLVVPNDFSCTSQLRSHIITLVIHPDSGRNSQLWLYLMITSSCCVRLLMIKLDDYSILQHDHLVRSRLSFECMIHSALKISVSHSSACSSVRLMGQVTNEHLVWLDLRENPNTSSGSVLPMPCLSQGIECLVMQG